MTMQGQIRQTMDTGVVPALALENVSLRLGGRAVLNDITLTADERRIGLVGRNGSGKTTLGRVIAGLAQPDAGAVRIHGVDTVRDRKAALRTVGILFQNPDHQIIFPTVDEEISFGLRQLGHDKTSATGEVARMLARFDKEHWTGAATHTLSQGQKQLLCLMAVLVMRPRFIVLDEPFSGLDIPTRMQLERYVATVDATILHITHDPAGVRSYDRVVWMEAGQICQNDDAARVLPLFEEQMAKWGTQDDLSDLHH